MRADHTDAVRAAAQASMSRTPAGFTLDPAAYYGLAGKIVRLLEPETEAHPVTLLSGFLTMFGNAINTRPHIPIGGDKHGARLNICNVGKTARARKGTGGSLIREVMSRAAPDWSERIVGGFGSGESLVDAVRDATEDDPGPGDNRLMVREPEWGRVLSVVEREGSTLSMVAREAWDGTRLAVRSRKGTVTASAAHISVLADVTLEELRRSLSSTQAANGFANRYLFFLVHRSRKLPTGGELTDDHFEFCANLTSKALVEARNVGRMRRTDDAERVWASIYNAIPDDDEGLFGAIVARAEAHVLRLSVTYALLDGSNEIDVAHLRAAAALWDYARASALTIFGESTGDPVADRLYQALAGAGDGGLDGEQQLALFSRHQSSRKVSEARELLESKGLAVSIKEQTGGRPKLRTFLAQKAQEAREIRLMDLPALTSLPAQPPEATS